MELLELCGALQELCLPHASVVVEAVAALLHYVGARATGPEGSGSGPKHISCVGRWIQSFL